MQRHYDGNMFNISTVFKQKNMLLCFEKILKTRSTTSYISTPFNFPAQTVNQTFNRLVTHAIQMYLK